MLILEIYRELIEDYLAIPVIKGFKSDKEKFVGAKYTTTLEALMADGRALQMGTSHHLGQNFSKPFEIKYLGRDSKEHLAWQTSWGISWRLIGALIMIHGDDKGLILPPRIAPIQVVIIPIFRDNDAQLVLSKANEIACDLKRLDIRVHVDEREEYTAGWKFNEWEMKGVPLRINIGPKDIEKDQVELVRRDALEKSFSKCAELDESVISILEQIQRNLLLQAKKRLEENTTDAANYDMLKSVLMKRGGFVVARWCGDIRVILFEEQEILRSKVCVYCSKTSQKTAIFAKAY
jgi:prolyl-tRNA synthetase